MEGRLFMGPWGHRLPSEAVSVLHDLPAGSQQHGGAEGGGQAAEPRPALPRVHLPHHGDSAWTSLGASPGWKVMGRPPCLPGLSWVGPGQGPCGGRLTLPGFSQLSSGPELRRGPVSPSGTGALPPSLLRQTLPWGVYTRPAQAQLRAAWLSW